MCGQDPKAGDSAFPSNTLRLKVRRREERNVTSAEEAELWWPPGKGQVRVVEDRLSPLCFQPVFPLFETQGESQRGGA